jgi:hypothetical protein
MAMPPTNYESHRQLQLMTAIISRYVHENVAVTEPDDAVALAHELHNAGFVLASTTGEAEQNARLDAIEERLAAVEAVAGIVAGV